MIIDKTIMMMMMMITMTVVNFGLHYFNSLFHELNIFQVMKLLLRTTILGLLLLIKFNFNFL
jgi:hypothetical protein